MSKRTGNTMRDVEREDANILAAASEWVARFGDDRRSGEDQRAFEAWLAIDPRHGEAYDAVSRTWEDVGQLGHLRALADPEPLPPFWMRWINGAAVPLRRPGFVSGGLIAAAAAAAAFFFLPPMLQPPDARYQTQIAQTRELRLPDGSVVTLGADSRVSYRFADNERRVMLESGEAFFDVVHDESRPFVVEAGDTLIRDVGTKFNVNRAERRVSVSVLEGIVSVSNRGDNSTQTANARVLNAGQRIDVEAQPVLFTPPAALPLPQTIQASNVAAWRDGRLSYDDVPLSELVADVNRYYAPGVRISEDAARVRVTGSFRTNQIPEFLSTLSQALPVEVERSQDQSFVVATRPQTN